MQGRHYPSIDIITDEWTLAHRAKQAMRVIHHLGLATRLVDAGGTPVSGGIAPGRQTRRAAQAPARPKSVYAVHQWSKGQRTQSYIPGRGQRTQPALATPPAVGKLIRAQDRIQSVSCRASHR